MAIECRQRWNHLSLSARLWASLQDARQQLCSIWATFWTLSCKQVTDTIIKFMRCSVDDADYALMLNNLGTTSCLEMGVLLHSTLQHLKAKQTVRIVRVYSGTYMTATDMSGFSISLLKLKEGWTDYLDQEAKVDFASSQRFCGHANTKSHSSLLMELYRNLLKSGLASCLQTWWCCMVFQRFLGYRSRWWKWQFDLFQSMSITIR